MGSGADSWGLVKCKLAASLADVRFGNVVPGKQNRHLSYKPVLSLAALNFNDIYT